MTKMSAEINSRNITEMFDQEEWDNGGGPLSDESLKELGLTDVTYARQEFTDDCEQNGDTLGYYKAEDGAIFRADLLAGDEVRLQQVSEDDIIKLQEKYN